MAYLIEEAKRLVVEAGLRLQAEGLIVRTWGNISARVSDKQFVITPSGRSYDTLTDEDIVVVDIKKCTYEGDIKPSSECGIHADVYAMRKEVNFVIHTHQIYASAISVLGQDIQLSEDEKTFLGDRIPCAEYAMSSTPKLRKQVKKCLKHNEGCKSMLLSNHGALCMGADYDNAFEISSVMEQVCRYQYDKVTASLKYKLACNIPESVGNLADEDVKKVEAAKDIRTDGLNSVSEPNEVNEFSGVNESTKDDPFGVDGDSSQDDIVSFDAKGYVDYGSSQIDGETITLTLGENEYQYNLYDKKPIGKGIHKRSLNKIAHIHAKIYDERKITHIYHVTLPNIVDASCMVQKGFKPYIDDQAQIVGTYVSCVGKITKKAHLESASAIAKALKQDEAVLIAGQGALCVGNSYDDLEAISYVLEKGCMALKVALCDSKATSVPSRIARKERTVYKESYSKLKG